MLPWRLLWLLNSRIVIVPPCCVQGDIEAVAAKSPQGLTLLMEQVSGSDAFKQQYEELQAQAVAAEEKVCVWERGVGALLTIGCFEKQQDQAAAVLKPRWHIFCVDPGRR